MYQNMFRGLLWKRYERSDSIEQFLRKELKVARGPYYRTGEDHRITESFDSRCNGEEC